MTTQLNDNQMQAVNLVEGAGLILAGAGSGKTRVLTQRIIHLIRQQKISPWAILAVTFTNKAAQEMKHRVQKELGDIAKDLWISTFHSICLRILRRHAKELGYESQFAIYDDSDQLTLMKKILNTLELSDKIFVPKAMLKHIDRAKNNGVSCDDFETNGDYFLTKVGEVYKYYQRELKKNQAMDFGDLILQVIHLFERHPQILQHYQNQFVHILVDEYQDTNPVQYKLIKLLAAKWQNLFVVGDDDQSIYRFRGAEIANILGFQKDYPNALVVRLEQNYRSTQKILAAANSVIRNNSERMGKELWTQNAGGDSIKVLRASDEKNEAQYIANDITQKRQDFQLKNIAVFYRTNAQSRAIEDELRKKNIAYKIFGGMRFYDRAEIRDVMAYLQVLLNPADSLGLKRIINVPARGIGKTTLEKLDDVSQQQNVTLMQIIEQPGSTRWGLKMSESLAKKLFGFYVMMEELKKALNDLPLTEFVPHLLEKTGYWQMLKDEKTIESESRIENLSEFVNVLEEFVAESPTPTLSEFMDQISLASKVDGLDDADNYVTLMTIHLAKGLEFPVVYLAGLEEGLFPHVRSLENEADLEEERRICYVGMTRAMQHLHITYADVRRIFGTSQYNQPSRFLREMDESVLEEVHFNPWGNTPQFVQVPQNRMHKPASPMQRAPSRERHIDVSDSQVDNPYPTGALVRHEVFGKGRIQQYIAAGEDSKVTVHFQNGAIKTLSLKYAHLTMLDS